MKAGDTERVAEEIRKLEELMQLPDFWDDKNKAQAAIRELEELKAKKEGLGKYDKGNAIVTIISGAGGDDAEDFSRMLFEMYMKFSGSRGWGINFIHENKNEHGGYRNISFEVAGSMAYGDLKNEAGVHRLVRISPFNAKKLRHTSFSLVEVLPKFSKLEEKDIILPPQELKIEFSRSSGPGGQNVNKRDTAVRIVHIPTNLSVHAATERSQEQNRELALAILRAKIFKYAQAEKKSIEESMHTTKNTEIEWGNQIRSYVLHPYKMVKDHRTGAETSQVDAVLSGELEEFIEAERNL
ncbi:MAG: Peptide chain release factor 2 [Parcubacteria group bacterium GW2011_GWA1_47_11]|nr:MAG: Peptide chain release factor 2 [Parcubacteria group bacterium GW2011_GWA1_47_11]